MPQFITFRSLLGPSNRAPMQVQFPDDSEEKAPETERDSVPTFEESDLDIPF